MTNIKPPRKKSPTAFSDDMPNSFSAIFNSAINKQKKKVFSALVQLQNAHEKTKPKTKAAPKRKPVLFKFELGEGISNIQKQFSQVYSDIGKVHIVASLNCYVRAMTYLDKALESIKLGKLEIAIEQFALASASIGSANAFASNNQFVSVQAKIKADASHKGTHAVRKKVIKYWEKKISHNLSAAKAADEMLGMPAFSWKSGEGASHKFLAECVRAQKKRIAVTKKT